MRVDMRENPKEAMRCRAFLDGVDVSNECFAADDEEGFVLLYKLNGNGRKYRDGDEAAWERKEGTVRIERKRELTSKGAFLLTYDLEVSTDG